jgi:signal transduction histidine kinase
VTVKAWRPLALFLVPAAAGAVGTLLAAAAAGMHADDLRHIVWLIVPALLSTVAAVGAVRLLLARLSIRQGVAAVSFVGAAVALANLAVLSAVMFVSGHDATVVAVFLVYSAGAGVGAALALAGAQTAPSTGCRRPHSGWRRETLEARVGALDGTELDALGRAVDDMADRLARLPPASAARGSAATRPRDGRLHDLRTPPARLRAMTEAIDDRVVDDTETFRRYGGDGRRSISSSDWSTICSSSHRSRPRCHREPNPSGLGVVDVVRSAVARSSRRRDDQALAVESVWTARRCAVPPHMVRVLQTLLSNAVRHTPADGTIGSGGQSAGLRDARRGHGRRHRCVRSAEDSPSSDPTPRSPDRGWDDARPR